MGHPFCTTTPRILASTSWRGGRTQVAPGEWQGYIWQGTSGESQRGQESGGVLLQVEKWTSGGINGTSVLYPESEHLYLIVHGVRWERPFRDSGGDCCTAGLRRDMKNYAHRKSVRPPEREFQRRITPSTMRTRTRLYLHQPPDSLHRALWTARTEPWTQTHRFQKQGEDCFLQSPK